MTRRAPVVLGLAGCISRIDVTHVELRELLSFDGDDVRVHWTSKHRNHHGHILFAEPNVALDLVTSRDNVASIDYERRVVGRTDLSGVIASGVLSAFSAVFALVLAGYLARDLHQAIAP